MKIQWKLNFSHLIFLHTNLWFLDLSQKNLNKNSTSCPSELKKIPRSWIESRKLPAKFQLCRSFQLPRTQRPQGFFRAPYWSHQKRSWPKKNSSASFDLLNLCAKFLDHILTRSTLNREATRPPKGHICTCLTYRKDYHDNRGKNLINRDLTWLDLNFWYASKHQKKKDLKKIKPLQTDVCIVSRCHW